MKTIILIFTNLIVLSYSFASNIQFNGVLNDVSPDELKIIYSCKNANSEAYSDGMLYAYDIMLNKKVEIAKIKNLDYNIKSYFINNDTIMIVTDSKISLYNLKTNKEIITITEYGDTEYLVSSKKEIDNFYFILIDNKSSELKLMKLNIDNFKVENILSVNISIVPTDNFFDFFVLSQNVFYLDNGILKIANNYKTEVIVKDLLFNDESGNYIIASNGKTICFIKETNFKNQLIIKSLTDNSLKIINIPTPISKNARIETVRSNNQFILFTDSHSFLINDNGTFIKTSERKIYNKNKIIIKETGTYKFELFFKTI